MNDLILGGALLAGLSGALFVLGCRVGRTRPVWLTNLLGLAAIVGLAAYTVTLRDNVLLARLLPVSCLIVVGNWFPPGMSLLAGLAWSLIPRLEPGDAPAAAPHHELVPPGSRPATPPGIAPGDPPDRPAARRASRAVRARRLVAVLSLQAVG